MEMHMTYRNNYVLIISLVSKGGNPEVPLKGMLLTLAQGAYFQSYLQQTFVFVWLSHYSTWYFYHLQSSNINH